jgi:hypothetical protein
VLSADSESADFSPGKFIINLSIEDGEKEAPENSFRVRP